MSRGLTVKQNKFIDFYCETGDATASAKKAGYSHKTATSIGAENLRKLHNEIQKRLDEKESKRIAKADEVLRFLTATMRGEGVESDYKDRLRASELLGKRHRLFTERVEIIGNIEVVIDD